MIVYFRSLAPKAEKTFTLHLRADVPGEFRGRAACAYLYYNPQAKHWNDALAVTVRAK